MKKMPFRFARRVRNLEIKSSYYCPTKKKSAYLDDGARRDSSSSSSSHHHPQQICPSCVLPIVVAFIFGFTVIQLIVIHRTIMAYKSRSMAFEEVYGPSHNDTKSQGDLLAFSRKFDSALLPIMSVFNSSSTTSKGGAGSRQTVFEWKPMGQAYPYRIPTRHTINHHGIWTKQVPQCPEVPVDIHGNISINVKSDVSLDTLTRDNPQVKPGGRWSPSDCSARFHVALIIPYRYRWNHLKLLLSLLHPMLRKQKMSYQIFVAEQFGNYTFNKGLLMNAAFLLALNSSTAFDCVIFHDVDLLPETDTNIYGCAKSPSHLSVSIDAYAYRLPYSKLVGGVFAISVEHFIQVNGYSNLYWGWGAEDDDMYKRLIANQLPLSRPRPDLAKYKMLQHGRRVPNQFINPLIRTARLRYPQDGLTTCHFRLVSSSSQALFTHFLVDVGQPSWSVLEPNVHLESMIPPTPSSPILHGQRTSSSSSPTNSITQSLQQQHRHHSSSSGNLLPKKSNELFILTGIARDFSSSSSSGRNHLYHSTKNRDKPEHSGRQIRSLNGHSFRSLDMESSPAILSAQNEQSTGEESPMNNAYHHQHEMDTARALDPDVPVVQDEDDDEAVDDDADIGGDSANDGASS